MTPLIIFWFTTVSDGTLVKLYCLFGATFEKALELYESGRVTHVSPLVELTTKIETRWLLQVNGFSVKVYTLFPNVNFCTCKAFRYRSSCLYNYHSY